MTTYDTVANGYLVPVYATYLVATVAICTWLAITLYRNGAVFLADVFPDQPEMAQAVNRLLLTGFAMATKSAAICASMDMYLTPASPPMTTSGAWPRRASGSFLDPMRLRRMIFQYGKGFFFFFFG